MATLKFYFERRNYRAYIFVFAISAPLFIYIYIYIYIYSIRASFHRHWWFIGQQRKGGDHLLFYSKNSTHSQTFRHLVTAAESSCSHLTFRFRACLEQGVPWHSGNNRVWIHAETRTWNDKNIQSFRHLLPTLHVRLLHVVLISTLVFIRLLLNEIYHLIDWWCNVCLLDDVTLDRFFVKAIWHGNCWAWTRIDYHP